MSATIFCCAAIKPYRPRYLSHESKFTSFMAWAAFPEESRVGDMQGLDGANVPAFAMQVVRQVNFGPLESTRYFVPREGMAGDAFDEVDEDKPVQSNFQKLNTYKNYKCGSHNKFFELNVYQKDPVNAHHWRANVARPAREIDLAKTRAGAGETRNAPMTLAAALAPATAANVESEEETESSRWSPWEAAQYGGDGYDREESEDKDLTACDKECGYCGKCSY